MDTSIIKVLAPTALAFIIGVVIAPIITHYLYQYKVWKKKPGKIAVTGEIAVEFNKLHKENENKTPRMGGIVIWGSISITILGLWLCAYIFPNTVIADFDFLTRSQTWIPFATLLVGSLVGMLNDVYDVAHHGNGLRLRVRLIFVSLVAGAVSWWFYTRLGITEVSVPFDGTIDLGFYIVPFFILISLGLYASGIIDGIDGLSGGIFAIIFTAYAGVAFHQEQVSLAAFCGTVAGGTLAFLWFNIPPARFWMTETGTMGLTMTLAVVALMTDTLGEGNGLSVLPIIALPLVITVCSNIIQIGSKKILHKKIFKVAPLHHHFEAIGWPGYKVTMRYWIFGFVSAVLGTLMAIAF